MKSDPVFFKTFIFDGCFGKYSRLNMPFCDEIGRCLYFLENVLPTPPGGYCFLVFKFMRIIHLWAIFVYQFQHENHLVNTALLRNLLIPQKRFKMLPHLSTLLVLEAPWHSKNSRNSGTQGTRTLKALGALTRHLKHFI